MCDIKSVSVKREPAVAGKFYTDNKKNLGESVDGFINDAFVGRTDADCAYSYVAPHAGYKYSGRVAGFTYKALSMKKDLARIDTFVMIGPDHTGLGCPVSISGCNWKTPLGVVENDLALTDEIERQSDKFTLDENAHRLEHSIEVQLPFLQRVVGWPRCCFILMGDQSIEYCTVLAKAIIAAAQILKKDITVIASSDFNHYEPADVANRKDNAVLGALEKLDFDDFHAKIDRYGDSACGYGPITVSGMFAKAMGANSGKLLKYANSGDITKDYKSVVAYSSIIFV